MTIANISNLADIIDYEFGAHEVANSIAGTTARTTKGNRTPARSPADCVES